MSVLLVPQVPGPTARVAQTPPFLWLRHSSAYALPHPRCSTATSSMSSGAQKISNPTSPSVQHENFKPSRLRCRLSCSEPKKRTLCINPTEISEFSFFHFLFGRLFLFGAGHSHRSESKVCIRFPPFAISYMMRNSVSPQSYQTMVIDTVTPNDISDMLEKSVF